jgi:hypothetical protein
MIGPLDGPTNDVGLSLGQAVIASANRELFSRR